MNYFLHTFKSNKTVIYNKISNSKGESLYPDIVFSHPFEESEITDDELFTITSEAISNYGSSKIIIASVGNTRDQELLASRMEYLHSESPSPDDTSLISQMAEYLMLTEAMKNSFKQLLSYYREIGGNPSDLFLPFIEEYNLPVGSKNEGKKIYELIRNKILG